MKNNTMLDYYHFYETRSGTSEPHLLWSPELRKEAIRSWGEPLTNCVARADCKENPSVFPPGIHLLGKAYFSKSKDMKR